MVGAAQAAGGSAYQMTGAETNGGAPLFCVPLTELAQNRRDNPPARRPYSLALSPGGISKRGRAHPSLPASRTNPR